MKTFKFATLFDNEKSNTMTLSMGVKKDFLSDAYEKSLISFGFQKATKQVSEQYVNFFINVENRNDVIKLGVPLKKAIEITIEFKEKKAMIVEADGLQILPVIKEEVDVIGFLRFTQEGSASINLSQKIDQKEKIADLQSLGFKTWKVDEDKGYEYMSMWLNKLSDKAKQMSSQFDVTKLLKITLETSKIDSTKTVTGINNILEYTPVSYGTTQISEGEVETDNDF